MHKFKLSSWIVSAVLWYTACTNQPQRTILTSQQKNAVEKDSYAVGADTNPNPPTKCFTSTTFFELA